MCVCVFDFSVRADKKGPKSSSRHPEELNVHPCIFPSKLAELSSENNPLVVVVAT